MQEDDRSCILVSKKVSELKMFTGCVKWKQMGMFFSLVSKI